MILAVLFFSFFALAGVCFAQSGNFGLGTAADISGLTKNKISAAGDIPTALGLVISVALGLVGVFFFLLLLYSGFTWMTAAGSSEKVDTAKSRLVSAAIGLIIVLAAYTLTSFVFSRFLTGTDNSAGPGEEAGQSTCTNSDCQTAADCEAVGGRSGSACGEGRVCCQTCASLRGACFNSNYEYCEGEKKREDNGVCAKDSRGQERKCCIDGQVIDLTSP